MLNDQCLSWVYSVVKSAEIERKSEAFQVILGRGPDRQVEIAGSHENYGITIFGIIR